MQKNAGTPLEIERKFLIRMPNTEALAARDGARVWRISQTYLLAPRGISRRIRRIREGEDIRYIYTEKLRISPTTAEEREREIDLLEYAALLGERDEARMTVEKTRYLLPCPSGHVAEVDVYDFWQDRATVEVELSFEDEAFTLPDCLSVVRDITADKRYKNAALAKKLPDDPL